MNDFSLSLSRRLSSSASLALQRSSQSEKFYSGPKTLNHSKVGLKQDDFIIPEPDQALPSYTFPTFVRSVTRGCLAGSSNEILSATSRTNRVSVSEVPVSRNPAPVGAP